MLLVCKFMSSYIISHKTMSRCMNLDTVVRIGHSVLSLFCPVNRSVVALWILHECTNSRCALKNNPNHQIVIKAAKVRQNLLYVQEERDFADCQVPSCKMALQNSLQMRVWRKSLVNCLARSDTFDFSSSIGDRLL